MHPLKESFPKTYINLLPSNLTNEVQPEKALTCMPIRYGFILIWVSGSPPLVVNFASKALSVGSMVTVFKHLAFSNAFLCIASDQSAVLSL